MLCCVEGCRDLSSLDRPLSLLVHAVKRCRHTPSTPMIERKEKEEKEKVVVWYEY